MIKFIRLLNITNKFVPIETCFHRLLLKIS